MPEALGGEQVVSVVNTDTDLQYMKFNFGSSLTLLGFTARWWEPGLEIGVRDFGVEDLEFEAGVSRWSQSSTATQTCSTRPASSDRCRSSMVPPADAGSRMRS